MHLTFIKEDYIQQFKRIIIFTLIFSAFFFLLAISLRYTFPFLVAFLLAWVLQPGMRFLIRRCRFRPTLAALFITLFFFVMVFGVLTLMILGLVREAAELIQRIDPDQFAFVLGPAQQLISQLHDFFSQIDAELIQQYETQLMTLAQSSIQILDHLVRFLVYLIASLPVWLTMFFVIIFATFFLARDLEKIKTKVFRVFSESFIKHFQAVWATGLRMMGRYIRSYLLVYSLTFVQTLLLFSILRIPYALILSLCAGIADVLPILGVGLIYWPLAAYLFINGQTALGVAVLIGWIVITAIRQFVEPKLVADSIEIHPVMILAILFFGLRAQSLLLIVYLTLLLMTYQMVKKAGLFEIVKETVKARSEPSESVVSRVDALKRKITGKKDEKESGDDSSSSPDS